MIAANGFVIAGLLASIRFFPIEAAIITKICALLAVVIAGWGMGCGALHAGRVMAVKRQILLHSLREEVGEGTEVAARDLFDRIHSENRSFDQSLISAAWERIIGIYFEDIARGTRTFPELLRQPDGLHSRALLGLLMSLALVFTFGMQLSLSWVF